MRVSWTDGREGKVHYEASQLTLTNVEPGDNAEFDDDNANGGGWQIGLGQ